jgi:tetratricopeptide (TPR) repeat protein/TolB-like protein
LTDGTRSDDEDRPARPNDPADGRSEILERLARAAPAAEGAEGDASRIAPASGIASPEGRSALMEQLGKVAAGDPGAAPSMGPGPAARSTGDPVEGRSALLEAFRAPATVATGDPSMLSVARPTVVSAADGRSALQEAIARQSPAGAPPAGQLIAGSAIGARYEIVRLLGKGGMGEVYLARDLELGREVALKLVAPHLASTPGMLDRFRREIQLSSLVTHPNVLRVYDLGESGGLRFLTMQYIEGRSLATVLAEERPLPLERATALFRQVCDGLAAAHDQGVLHRDLKPQNVMVDAAWRAYVMDFGLATSDAVSTMTQTGMVVGTPHYMSPEQVTGEPLDARSDLFSAGVMLYEMLTGALPFQGETVFGIMMRRTRGPPPPARQLNPAIPAHLAGIVDRCLAIDVKLRYASAREVLRDLDAGNVKTSLAYRARRHRRVWMAIAALLVVAGLAWPAYRWVARRMRAPGIELAGEVPLVGVVPFSNRTGDGALDWTGDGIARLVADGLALSRHVRVASPDRMAELRKASPDDAAFRRAAAESGVTHLLTGDVLTGPKGFTVTSRLVEAASGSEITSRRVDSASRGDVVGASTEVTQAVKKGLRIPLVEGVDTFAADFATHNNEAYETYVRGLGAWSGYHYRDAEKLFRAAVARAPDFAMAHFRLANVLAATSRSDEALASVRTAASQASRLSDREARYVRAAEAYFSQRPDEAVKQYQELIARYPYDLEPRQFLAQIFLEDGEWQKAAEQGRAMAQIDARSPSTHATLGSAYLGMNDFNQALAEFRSYSELDPGSANAHHLLADSFRAQGVMDMAVEEYAAALRIDPTFHFSTIALAEVEVLRGRLDEAERLLAPLAAEDGELPRFRADAAFGLASVMRARGRFRDAARTLEAAQPVLEVEKAREAMGLAVRALCAAELGDFRRAEDLARTSIDRAPSPAITRYLFALASIQLRQGRTGEARATAARMLEKAVPPSDPNRTADKAAAYVSGMAALREGKVEEARRELSRAVALSGYEYAIYRLGLAEAHRASRAFPEALANAKQARAPLDLRAPRLDLEVDRVRALLEEARIQAAMGRGADAAAAAASFLEAWTHPDPGLEEVSEAKRLASRGQ